MGLKEDANELKGIFKELQGYVQQTMNGLSSGKDSLNEIAQIASREHPPHPRPSRHAALVVSPAS